MNVTICYPWTGDNHDGHIEKVLGTKAHSSGCGFGERDMQFDLPRTQETLQNIRALQNKLTIESYPDQYPCHFCEEWAEMDTSDNGVGQMTFKCKTCGAGLSVYPSKL